VHLVVPMKIKNLHISNSLLASLTQLSKSCFPEESCAVLFGHIEGEISLELYVTKMIELKNIVHSNVEFRWDDMEFYNHCIQQAKDGLSFVGVFHSHPNDPYISGYDRDVIKNIGKLYPELVWIVYGNRTQTFKAFTLLHTNRFEEIPIESRHN